MDVAENKGGQLSRQGCGGAFNAGVKSKRALWYTKAIREAEWKTIIE